MIEEKFLNGASVNGKKLDTGRRIDESDIGAFLNCIPSVSAAIAPGNFLFVIFGHYVYAYQNRDDLLNKAMLYRDSCSYRERTARLLGTIRDAGLQGQPGRSTDISVIFFNSRLRDGFGHGLFEMMGATKDNSWSVYSMPGVEIGLSDGANCNQENLYIYRFKINSRAN